MSQSSVKIQLNDIIEINAPSNTNLDKKNFLVIYASESTIKLIEVETFDEVNLLIKGKMKIQDQVVESGDIFVIPPYEIADPEFIEDCEIVILKTPSNTKDKYVIDIKK